MAVLLLFTMLGNGFELFEADNNYIGYTEKIMTMAGLNTKNISYTWSSGKKCQTFWVSCQPHLIIVLQFLLA